MSFFSSVRGTVGPVGSARGGKKRSRFLYDFTYHKFTNAGASGNTGPTLGNLQSSYSSNTWAQNTEYLNRVNYGIQKWKVPATGWYKFKAAGASGGSCIGGTVIIGAGNIHQTAFQLNQGDILYIAVGQKGENSDTPGDSTPTTGFNSDTDGGGGGGTFVAILSSNTTYTLTTDSAYVQPLMVAGGGGGETSDGGGVPGYYSTDGSQPSSTGTQADQWGYSTGGGWNAYRGDEYVAGLATRVAQGNSEPPTGMLSFPGGQSRTGKHFLDGAKGGGTLNDGVKGEGGFGGGGGAVDEGGAGGGGYFGGVSGDNNPAASQGGSGYVNTSLNLDGANGTFNLGNNSYPADGYLEVWCSGNGSDQTQAAVSATALQDVLIAETGAAPDGLYWMFPPEATAPFQAYVDFSTPNGPWVHVGTAVSPTANTCGPNVWVQPTTWTASNTSVGTFSNPYDNTTSTFNADAFRFCRKHDSNTSAVSIMAKESTTGYVQLSGLGIESWRDVYKSANTAAWPTGPYYLREFLITSRSNIATNSILYGASATASAHDRYFAYAFDSPDTYAMLNTQSNSENDTYAGEADQGFGANEYGPNAGDQGAALPTAPRIDGGITFEIGSNGGTGQPGGSFQNFKDVAYSLWIKN